MPNRILCKLLESTTETFNKLTQDIKFYSAGWFLGSAWYFGRDGQEIVEDEPRSGRPITSGAEENAVK